MTPKTEIPPEQAASEYPSPAVSEDGICEYELNLLPPPSLSRPWWRTLASNLRDRIVPEKLPPLELTSHPVNLGMLPGDMLTMPWYRTIFMNLGNVITPETLPPLELESQPVEVGELIADRMSHPWFRSLWWSVRDSISSEKLPPLQLTAQPVDPYVASEKVLRAPHWSSLIDTPKVFLPDEPEIEYQRPAVPGAPPVRRKPIHVDIDFTHVMVSQLKDDLSRSRLREAFWMSVVAHMTVVILIIMAPKYLPGYKKGVALISAADLMRSKQVTFLELPPDLEKNVPKPNTNVLSDKNRIAQSRHPTLDKKTLQELRDMRRPGAPGAPSAPAQPSPAVPAQPQQMAQAQPSPNPAGGGAPEQTNPQQSQIQLPQTQARNKGPNPFQQPLSAGAAIQQATREAAATRGSVVGGAGGQFGLGTGPHGGIASNLEILSDTQGVDFGPYLSRIVQVVRINWYNLIPEVARPPLLKKGKVSIQFAIMPNGSVAGMQLVGPSGDVSLDRAAWGGITASSPFEPLPHEFHGPYLALRFNFYYNPNKGDMLQ